MNRKPRESDDSRKVENELKHSGDNEDPTNRVTEE
jgi:hypothetical protein